MSAELKGGRYIIDANGERVRVEDEAVKPKTSLVPEPKPIVPETSKRATATKDED